MLKAIIFDIDNTLYDYDTANALAIDALRQYTNINFGWSSEETDAKIKAAYSSIQNEIGKKAAIHNRLIRYQRILETDHLPLHPYALEMYDLYWNTLIDSAKAYDGAESALEQLKAAGYVLGIGTNMTSVIQFRKLTKFGLLKYFDFVVTSEESDCEKPQKELFLQCAAKAGYDPSFCLYIGDSLIHDIIASEEAGFHTLWFRPEKAPLSDGASLPVDHEEYIFTGDGAHLQFSDFNLLPSIIDALFSSPHKEVSDEVR